MTPYISIIVPVYQAEKTLDRCVGSVLAQTYNDWEMILVDDGSRDKSGVICDQYAMEYPQIRVIHQGNAGVSAARNAGIQLAKGEYLLFLDSDDALLPNALSSYAEASERGKFDVVIAGMSVIEDGQESRRIALEEGRYADSEIWELISRNPVPFGYAGGKLVRREIVHSNQLFFAVNMQSQEDLDFFLSVYNGCEHFRIISDVLYAYYYAPPTRTSPSWDFVANQLKLLRLAREKTALSAQAESCVQKRILSLLYTSLYSSVEQGNFDTMVQRMNAVGGLRDFLQTVPAKGEHRFVARAFVGKHYRQIKGYFKIRNSIRDVYRMIRREKH